MKYSGVVAVAGKVRIHAHPYVLIIIAVCECSIEYYLNDYLKYSISNMHNTLMNFVVL